jgi:hypothetical protein
MSYGADVQRKNTGGILATVSDHEYVVGKVPDQRRMFSNILKHCFSCKFSSVLH